MSLRIMVTTAVFVVICLSSSAMGYSDVQHGYYQLEVHTDPDFQRRVSLVLAVVVVLLIAIAVGVCVSLCSGGTGRCDASDDADRFQNEADLIRQITKHQDAHTAMMRSEIEHARAEGEYRERPDIAAHEQRLRDLRNRLQ